MNHRVLAILAAVATCGCQDPDPAGQVSATVHPSRPVQAVPQEPVVFPESETEPEPGRVFKVGGEVKAPRVVKRVEVLMPESIRGQRYQLGVLIISAIIDETGKVRNVKAINHPKAPLTHLYIDAVKQWQFEPGTYRGKPVAVEFTLTVGHFPVTRMP